MKDILFPRRMWRRAGALTPHYDVVIIGGGVQGLATAYYLAKNHGITQRRRAREELHRLGRIGPEHRDHPLELPHGGGARFYQASLELYDDLSAELDFNVIFTQRGVLTLAHSERALITMTERASVNRLLGIDTPHRRARRDRGALPAARPLRRTDLAGHRRDVAPARRDPPSRRGRLGLRPRRRPPRRRDPPGHRGDRARARAGACHGRRDDTRRDRVRHGDQRGRRLVVGARGLAGLRLPITTHILQAFVTEPVRRFLDPTVVSSQMRIYIHQTTRGEFLFGHGRQHFIEGNRSETGGVVGHGIGNDQFAVVHESAAGINDIRHVPLTLPLIRLEQGFTQAADHFAGIVAVEEECADAIRSHRADTMAEDQPACVGFNR